VKKRWIATQVSALCLILIIISYLYLDIPITKYCLTLSPTIKKIAELITTFGIATWYLIASIIFYLFYRFIYKNNRFADRSLFVFLSLSITGIFNLLVKWIAGRHRPVDLFNPGYFGFDYFGLVYELTSFPSGHSQTAFTLATALTLLFPCWGIPAFIIAGAVGISRIILTSHYLSDVIAGAGIGILGPLIIRYYFDRNKFKKAK
jgi:membrane-associated phospholipid phosphatase